MSTIKRAWRFAVTDGVPIRSLYVTFIVGTVLNVINQGDVLLAAGSISWFKVALTYVVPYCVSTYGAVSFRMTLPVTGSEQDARHRRSEFRPASPPGCPQA